MGSERLPSTSSSSVSQGQLLVETQMPYVGAHTSVRITRALCSPARPADSAGGAALLLR